MKVSSYSAIPLPTIFKNLAKSSLAPQDLKPEARAKGTEGPGANSHFVNAR
jgi:hypothetical protein